MYNEYMIRRALFFLASFFFLLIIITPVAHADVNDFTIDSFQTNYHLSKDEKNVAIAEITETIDALFPSFDQNHGIERAIPTSYKGQSLDVDVMSVTKTDGQSWNYTTRTSNDNLILRIGDADNYVHDQQTYVIKYSVRNVISFYEDHDEWYWDVNGDQWQQPVNAVSATISLDASLAEKLLPDKKCYAGRYGSTGQNCQISSQDDGSLVVSSSAPLSANETLTFVLGFQKGTFSPPPTNWAAIIMWALAIFVLLILPPVLAFIVMLRRWLKSGRDPKARESLCQNMHHQKI